MLTPEQKQFYADNGYLVVPGLLSAEEAAFYRREAHDLSARLSAIRDIDASWGSAAAEAMGKKTSLLHCHDVQFQSAAFTRLLANEKLAEAASDIIGRMSSFTIRKCLLSRRKKARRSQCTRTRRFSRMRTIR